MQKPVKSFTVKMDIERSITVVVEAGDEDEARGKANDLNYKVEVSGEITRWVVRDIAEMPEGATP
ncbi:hypothetical protein IP69_04315 [Bosea sp. AAP35]|uniref:hypothetical protein n=1 Tax=Bosea sp. AAP35 TaxID=1523417 RepID=UPI0006B8CB6F|nr:hypothetical protein [Bosea sp. AAP35]KPF72036.1 hypothetical protein IP69_04315 [Bosea sp. AAP35]